MKKSSLINLIASGSIGACTLACVIWSAFTEDLAAYAENILIVSLTTIYAKPLCAFAISAFIAEVIIWRIRLVLKRSIRLTLSIIAGFFLALFLLAPVLMPLMPLPLKFIFVFPLLAGLSLPGMFVPLGIMWSLGFAENEEEGLHS